MHLKDFLEHFFRFDWSTNSTMVGGAILNIASFFKNLFIYPESNIGTRQFSISFQLCNRSDGEYALYGDVSYIART